MTYQERWAKKYGGKVVPYSQLSRPAQLAAAYYMAVDGEAWELPPDFPMRIEDAKFDRYLPWFRKKYGKTRWGYVEIPMQEIVDALQERGIDIEYMPVPEKHSKKDPWPIILINDDEVIQDGWHRFQRYYNIGLKKVPALYYPKAKNPVEPLFDRKLKAKLLR